MSAGYSKRDPVEVLRQATARLFELGQDDLADELEVVTLKFLELSGKASQKTDPGHPTGQS